MEWYVARGGSKIGPLEHSELLSWAASGELKATDLVWRPGFQKWVPAGEVPGLLLPPSVQEVAHTPLVAHQELVAAPAGTEAGASAAEISASSTAHGQVVAQGWYYILPNERQPRGPIPDGTLRSWLRDGRIPLTAVLSQPGSERWYRAAEVGFAPERRSPIGAGIRLGRGWIHKPRAGNINWYFEALRKYAVFRGRARRKEFWYYTLYYCLIAIVLNVPFFLLFVWFAVAEPADQDPPGVALLLWIPYILFLLASVIPNIAVSVRRLHDIGRSGWWVLINLVPYVGWLGFLIFAVLDSDSNENKYGPNPKAVAGPDHRAR